MGPIPGLLALLVSTFANMAVLMASWILLQRSLGHSLLLPLLALAPAVVFHMPLGYLCDRFPKAKVLRYSALLSLVPVALTLPLLHAGMRGTAMGMLALLSLLGSLHSVARYALLKELAGVRLLAPAMAAPLFAWCKNTIAQPVSAAMASMRPITCAIGPLAFSSSIWKRRRVSKTIRRRPSAIRLR